ncbi:unnamed protein product [Heligmosomoides polygyrus]|uniref:Transposase n=1 Tax=Heligmosomoides polygyrus TaxID=6339 RepID=A0A183FSU5_HELPZ|nr:unnamed protein product [Heligmosomoides polygyrus]
MIFTFLSYEGEKDTFIVWLRSCAPESHPKPGAPNPDPSLTAVVITFGITTATIIHIGYRCVIEALKKAVTPKHKPDKRSVSILARQLCDYLPYRSELRRCSKIRDAVAWAKSSKIRWAGHVMRFADTIWTTTVTD